MSILFGIKKSLIYKKKFNYNTKICYSETVRLFFQMQKI